MLKVAVVGATGAVGHVMRRVLLQHKFPYSEIRFLASREKRRPTDGIQRETYTILPIAPESFAGVSMWSFPAPPHR